MNPLPLDAGRQVLAFFTGVDRSYKKLAKASAKIIDYGADFLPDNPAATMPLTDEQAQRACDIVAGVSGVYVSAYAHKWDAAIRAAREVGER